ncbi:MAG: CHASE domain-containing protein [Planctomycetes bacterium]|nr:CHASE domain-containing protein [Planctomycetota bacterium]MCC7170023.1 CHASE domain-containing protein [Planctomycetota bacterium]
MRKPLTRELRHDVAGASARARTDGSDAAHPRGRWSAMAWVAALGVLLLTAAAGTWIARELARSDEARFDELTQRVERAWNERVHRFQCGLQAALALFVGSDSVSSAEFERLWANLHVDVEFPGALGIGFIDRVAPERRVEFEARARESGSSEFRIHADADGDRPSTADLAVLRYLEPREARVKPLGFDYSSVPVVFDALHRAAHTGKLAASGPIALRESATSERGFLALVPVYRNGEPVTSDVLRERALVGWIYMPVVDTAVQEALEAAADGEIACAFESPSEHERSVGAPSDAARSVVVSTLTFGGQSWNVEMRSTPGFVKASRWVLAGLTLAGLVVAGLVGLLFRSREGAVAKARALATAMTAELRSLAGVSASQAAELSAMADLARVGAWTYDVDSGVLHWSSQVKAIHDVAEDWVPSFESAIAFYPGAAAQEIRVAVERAIAHREDFDLELPFVTARDRSIWVRAIGRPIVDGDRVVRVAGAFQDITEQRSVRTALQLAKDTAEAATRSKSEFLAMMSHEIRTPLNGVIGVTSLLMESKLDAAQLDLVRTVHESGAALLVILNDVLDFSKIEAGRLELEHVPFDLHRVVDDARRLFAGRAQEKRIGLKSTVRAEVPERVVGDPGRLRQVLLNLVGNAVKFTERGSVEIALTTFEASGRKHGVRFEIVDTGPGMTTETMSRLFQPFTQASAAVTRAFGGTGLGLAIAKRLVESMGGSITCDSQAGFGSTFRVELVFDAADTKSTATKLEAVASPAGDRPALGLRVLLAEDNPINQKVARRMLDRLGCEVQVAENGQVAVELFAQGDYDVVLMDWHMPVLDGIEATKRIRAMERARHVPIIALTANAMPGDIDTCRLAGMDEFVAKPVTMERMQAVLAAVTRSASPRA